MIRSGPADRQRGTGLIGSLAAISAFLAFLFFAVQLLMNLYAASVVTADGFDAARAVAAHAGTDPGSGDLSAAEANAESVARRRLGAYGARVEFDWTGTDGDVVRLRLRARNPRVLPFVTAALPFTRLDRTIEVRVERFR